MNTILLIDSCPLARECLSAILRAKGYRVQSCGLISQARKMLTKKMPDLIISEIRLPDDNALNLMRSMQSNPQFNKVKVCVLTQAAAKKPIMEAIELGVLQVMLKSKFSIAGFLEQIDSVFNAPVESKGVPDEQESPSEKRYPIPQPAQDPSLKLKDIKPIISRKLLADRLDALEELCTMSEPVARLLNEIDSPTSDLEHIADILKLDQAIAMKVMQIANSSVYACSEPASTLKEAVLRIGLEHLRELVVGIGVIDSMNTNHQSATINPISLWEHSLCVALCSSKIASLCKGVETEHAFTAAILHDIGRLILDQALPDEYPQVLSHAEDLGIGLELVEKRLLLSDHTSIARNMLQGWNLPKDLVEAIGNHHELPSKIATVYPKNTKLVATVSLGNILAHAIGIGDSGNRVINPSEELIALLDLPAFSISNFVEGIEDELHALRSLFFPSDSSSDSPSGAPALLSSAPAPVFDRSFHPLYITMDEDQDTLGHWIMTQADTGSEQSSNEPNIVIVHIRQAKDRQALATKLAIALEAIESSPSTPKIPMLMLSPNGKIALADEIVTARPSWHLMTPFSNLHFEQAINHLLNGMIRPEEPWSSRRAA